MNQVSNQRKKGQMVPLDQIRVQNKHKAKFQRRVLKESNNPNKSVRNPVRLNLKKLPSDWFSPKKGSQRPIFRQTLQSQKFPNNNSLTDPQIHCTTQRVIDNQEIPEQLQRTSHFGSSQDGDLQLASVTTQCQTYETIENQKHDVTVQFESLKNSNQKSQTNLISESDQKIYLDQDKKENFDITFSHKVSKGKSFSVKRLKTKFKSKQKQKKISEFRIQCQNSKIQRQISPKKTFQTKAKQLNYTRKFRLRSISKQGSNTINCLSMQNTQSIFKEIKQIYFKRFPTLTSTKNHALLGASKELYLPPIMNRNSKN